MATYAGRYSEDLQDRYGNGYRNAKVAVQTLAAAPVTLYADRDRTTYVPAAGLAANEIKADSRGNLRFFADPGNYQIVVTPVGGSTLGAFPVSVFPDPLEPDASEGALAAEQAARIAADEALGTALTQTIADEATARANADTALSTSVAGKVSKAGNGSDFADVAEVRDNLGLGDAATQDAADLPVSDAQGVALALKAESDSLRRSGVVAQLTVTNENQVKASRGAVLVTPTPDATGNAVHPDVYYDAKRWNGFPWWMVMTPYANSDSSLENPSMLVSNDGITWIVPPGGSNPIEPAPVGGYNSDPDLVMVGRTLHLFFRQVVGPQESWWFRTSEDGVTWSPKEQILTSVSTAALLSPSWLHDADTGQWTCFCVDATASPYLIRKRTSASLAGPWTVTTPTIVAPVGDWWHLDVIEAGNELHALLNTTGTGGGGGGGFLYFARSVDSGGNWLVASTPIMDSGSPADWDDNQYRGSLVPIDQGGRRYRIFYSAIGANGWRIGVTDASLSGMRIDSLGRVGVNRAGVLRGQLDVQPIDSNTVGLVIEYSAVGVPSVNMQEWRTGGGVLRARITTEGGATFGTYAGTTTIFSGVGVFGNSEFQNSLRVATSGGALLVGNAAASGGGVGVLGIKNAATVPSSNPSSGGVLYVESGALKYRGSAGTITTVGVA